MKTTFYSLLFLVSVLMFSSCKKKEEVDPFESMMGSYNGSYEHENETSVTIDNNHLMVISELRQKNYGYYYAVANIEDVPFVIKLDDLTAQSDGTIAGKVKLYDPINNIHDNGDQVAGSGSFSYKDDKVTLIWTADNINGGWSITFISR